MKPLVLGLGRMEAGDDAAGRLVARGLAGAQDFDVAECEGLAADILVHLAGRHRVMIVDACRSGAAPGTILRRDAAEGVPVTSAASSHGLGLAEALEMARALAWLPAETRLWLIEGAGFRPGEGLSPAVEAAVTQSIAALPAVLADFG